MSNKDIENKHPLPRKRGIHSTKPKVAVALNKEAEQLSYSSYHLPNKRSKLSKESLRETPKNKAKNIPNKFRDSKSKVMKAKNIKHKNLTNSLTFEDIEKKIFDEKIPVCSQRKTLEPKKKKVTETTNTKTKKSAKLAVKDKGKQENKTTETTNTKTKKSAKLVVIDKGKQENKTTRETTNTKPKKSSKLFAKDKGKQENKTTPETTNTKPKKSSKFVAKDKGKLENKTTTKNLGVRLTNGKSDSDESDWEEVDELHEILTTGSTENNPTDVQVELKASNLLWGKRKKKFSTREEMIEEYIRKKVNRSIKLDHENMHKVHLLCLFAHGLYLNSVMGQEEVIAYALSIIPKNYFSPKRLDINHVEKFLSWYCKHIKLLPTPDSEDTDENYDNLSLDETLKKRFEARTAYSEKEFVVMFVITSRAVGMIVRLVQSLVPVTWKPSADSLLKPKKDILDSKTVSKSTTEKNLAPSEIKKKKRKVISSDSDPEFTIKNNSGKNGQCEDSKKETKQKRKSLLEWAEVYVEEEEKWISIDVIKKKIHCSSEIEARSSNLAYVIGFNPDQTVKDVTKRYVSNWLSHKNKIQLDGDWWAKSLQNFLGQKDWKDQAEDKELDDNLIQQPLPKTINEYKNHPLYALQRHLLKFEAIYPPDELPVGYIRGEPVFARSSVKTLFGRENWLKEAKTVRVDEEPYKIVKARPKYDKMTLQMIKDRPLELFGSWQVEDYDPPVAKNGKVPRNEYGNVDLFKPSMLPKGCVYLQVNGLYRIARKLNIDCAPAVVGFDFRSWGSHPVYDGFIVCEEFKDILMDAWNQEQFERVKKETEKRTNRVYSNWKKLIHKIILKDRLKEKYGLFSKPEKVVEEKKKGKRKVEQSDLDSVSHPIITHKVPQISINTSSQVIDAMAKRKKKKTNVKTNSDDASIHHSDNEEFSLTEKQEKIRDILKWNPKASGSDDSDPPLSDDSDVEEPSTSLNHTFQIKNRSQKDKTPVPAAESKRKINLKGIKRQKVLETAKEVGKRRCSQRIKLSNQKVQYDEGDQSDSDISLCESDVSDKNYNPISNIHNGSMVDLSEDSE